MFRKLFLLPVLSLMFSAGAFAAPSDWQNFIPNRQYLTSVDTFRGDQHGEFKNDLVACLGDGSAWKVHPTEKDKFARWQMGDIVHVGLRTSWYWFKREHKFELVNQTRNETVKVMLVQYPTAPLAVVLSETYLKDQSYSTYTYTDQNGRVNTTYVPKTTYEKKIALSDGTVWTMSSSDTQFRMGSKVYMAVNVVDGQFRYYLITGVEREAVWINAKKMN